MLFAPFFHRDGTVLINLRVDKLAGVKITHGCRHGCLFFQHKDARRLVVSGSLIQFVEFGL